MLTFFILSTRFVISPKTDEKIRLKHKKLLTFQLGEGNDGRHSGDARRQQVRRGDHLAEHLLRRRRGGQIQTGSA